MKQTCVGTRTSKFNNRSFLLGNFVEKNTKKKSQLTFEISHAFEMKSLLKSPEQKS